MRLTKPALSTLILLASSPALGHTLAPTGAGLSAGLSHPLMGFDHLLAMVGVGLWAALLGRRAIWLVPAAFMALLAGGATLALTGWVPALTNTVLMEGGIALSVLLLGVLLASAMRLPVGVAMGTVAAFALFHGAAHGAELPVAANPWEYGIGMLVATAALHGVGVAMGLGLDRLRTPALTRAGGVLIAAAGGLLLVA